MERTFPYKSFWILDSVETEVKYHQIHVFSTAYNDVIQLL